MKASERLKEIESHINGKEWFDNSDAQWLIARVKRLTEALEKLVKSEVIKSAQYITYSAFDLFSEAYLEARKALEAEGE